MKSHRSHDVVLLCVDCHQGANQVSGLNTPDCHPPHSRKLGATTQLSLLIMLKPSEYKHDPSERSTLEVLPGCVTLHTAPTHPFILASKKGPKVAAAGGVALPTTVVFPPQLPLAPAVQIPDLEPSQGLVLETVRRL